MKKTNELIAEFMGVGKHYEAQSSNMFNQYHTDWNRLMPVIEKIQYKHLENPELDYWNVDEIRLAIPNIQQVHYLVLEFIKDYNNGKN